MLQDEWEKLKKAVAARGKMLEDKRDLLEFLQKVDQVEAWIREKVSFVLFLHSVITCISL